MKKFARLLLTLLLLGCFLSQIEVSRVSAAPSFADTSFGQVWERSDRILTERTNVGRGFTWGPEKVFSGNEAYTDAPGGQRLVEYFDKARMEINNPGGNRNDPNFVTSGLLVKELVLGRQQNGNDVNNYKQFNPSEVQIAGDPNTGGANAIAPTYRSFRNVATFNNDNPADAKVGQTINSRIDKAGNITSLSSPDPMVRYSVYEAATRHNIADVFVTYGNAQGLIWNGTGYLNGPLFSPSSTYVFGLPITEPYWVRAVVAGVEKDVLIQLFERRALTYTPSNDPSNRVEMGNVGQHYYRWRYVENNPGGTPGPTTPINNTPTPTSTTAPNTSTPTSTTAPNTATPTASNTPTPTNTPVATSTPTPTDPFPAGWLARFNAIRAIAGLGSVTEDAKLSANADKHANYMILNPDDFRHDEDSSRPGYTIEGQQSAKESNLWAGSGTVFVPKDAIDGWMESWGHRFGMLRPELKRTGFAFRCKDNYCVGVLNVLGGLGNYDPVANVVYPGVGQQAVKTGLITWQFGPFEQKVVMQSMSLKDAQGNSVAIHTEATDGYWNVLVVKPDSPLATNTTYIVEIKAVQNGKAISKTWSFRTG